MAALDHFHRQHPGRFSTIPGAIKRGLEFVDPLYFDNGKGNYLSLLMHGGVWDTILAAQALAQAEETSEPLIQTAESLYELQTAQGGFPYGLDFEQYPDVDDTSRALPVVPEKDGAIHAPDGSSGMSEAGTPMAVETSERTMATGELLTKTMSAAG